MKKILAIILILVFMVTGCGTVEKNSEVKTTEKNEEIAVAEEQKEDNSEDGGEEIVTEEETTEETFTESVPTEPTQEIEKKTDAQKSVKKTETQKVAQTTAPTVSEPVATPAPEVKECEHLYEPVEWEEYTGIRKMVWGCNGCGFPLFTIDAETHDAVNIEDLYFHRECYSEKLGMMCPKPCGWHSEEYYQGYCYRCHGEIQLRACTYFYKRAEYCVKNAGDLGEYEKVEEGHAYIKSCSCGQNILMAGGEKGGLMLKKEVCKYCGDEKIYPEK